MRLWGRFLLAASIGLSGSLGLEASALASGQPNAGLSQLLPRPGEMPGFEASGSLLTYRTVLNDVSADPPALAKADATNLIKDGFVVELAQDQAGKAAGKTNGTSDVTRLRSHAAAVSYAKFTFHEAATRGPATGTKANVSLNRFAVPGIPGAKGIAQVLRYATTANADVEWVEGSCLLQIVDTTTGLSPLTSPVISAARAVYRRTKGSCTAKAGQGFAPA